MLFGFVHGCVTELVVEEKRNYFSVRFTYATFLSSSLCVVYLLYLLIICRVYERCEYKSTITVFNLLYMAMAKREAKETEIVCLVSLR